jgi:Bacterial transglutaminase-like N-terminal region
MRVFSVHHTTLYRYKNPIRPGLHQLMFRPRDSFDQRLLECHLEVTPSPAEIRWLHDPFGNCITLVEWAVEGIKTGRCSPDTTHKRWPPHSITVHSANTDWSG